MSRKRKLIINTVTALIYEAIRVICGFILPHLILSAFGSQYNGLISAITQFISYVALLQSGIGGATRAALYKPLADKNDEKISGIVNATSSFMKKISLIFLICLLLFAGLYPFLVIEEFDWIFTFLLVLIIGVTTFYQYYFAVSYQFLLKADQKEYITTTINIITIVLNTIVSAILIYMGCNIHIVKMGSAIVFLLGPIIITTYIKKHYRINKKVKPNNKAIAQRWDSFAHQISVFVHNNTDIVILSFVTNTLEISVYSVYSLILHGIRSALNSFSVGIEALFGNMIAKGETEKLKDNFEWFEWIIFLITTIVMSVSSVMILSFVHIYTKNITDVNYIRPIFCYIALASEYFFCIRIPYETVTKSFGHYKQTKKWAILEPIINIIVSIILVFPLKLVGVAIGTLIAMIIRTIQYSQYVQKNLIKRNNTDFIKLVMTSIVSVIFSISIGFYIIYSQQIENLRVWTIWSIINVLISSTVCIILNSLFFKNMIKKSIIKTGLIHGRKV